MDTLPPEVLRLVVEHLPHSACWSFARTCKILYAVIAPSLFETISLNLIYFAGRLDTRQFERHKAVLSSEHDGQNVGSYAERLVITFKNQFKGPLSSSTTVLEGLGGLPRLTACVRRLVINGMPGRVLTGAEEKHASEMDAFQQGLRQLERLESTEIAAQIGTNSSQWLQAVLPALPDSLHTFSLLPQFATSRDLGGITLPTTYRTPIKNLHFSCPQAGRACDALLASVLDNSSLLDVVCVGNQLLSQANVQALFASDRSYQHLRLETGSIPAVPDCRQSLRRQTKLEHLDASCGGDFLYYLASLPPSITSLKLEIHVLDPAALHRPRGGLLLAEVWSLLQPCLANPEWCHQLSLMHIKLKGWNEDLDNAHYEEEAEEIRKEALKLLRKRKIAPKTNGDFCQLKF